MDVQVVSYFPDGWHQTPSFEASIQSEAGTLREIACCVNSEQCGLSRSEQEAVDCSQYAGELVNERALLGAELFVVRDFQPCACDTKVSVWFIG